MILGYDWQLLNMHNTIFSSTENIVLNNIVLFYVCYLIQNILYNSKKQYKLHLTIYLY